MASENSSTSSSIVPVTGNTTAEYGNDEELIKTFRQLLPFGLNEKMLLNAKLTPVDNGDFFAADFDESIKSLRMKYLQVFLIHYPAAPKYGAKNSMNMTLPTQTWVAVSKCYDHSKVNAFGVHNNGSPTHLIQLTEVVAVGPMVFQMQWYSHYNYSYTESIKSNFDLVKNPLVETLARRYDVPAAQILALWTLQRGETIKPKITSTRYVMETIHFNIRLSQDDLSSLDILAVRLTNPLLFN